MFESYGVVAKGLTTEELFGEELSQREQSFQLSPDHPKIGGFIDDMRKIQRRPGAPATAISIFQLPVLVDMNPECTFKDYGENDEKMLLVDLKSFDKGFCRRITGNCRGRK